MVSLYAELKREKKIFDIDVEQSVLLHCNAQFRVQRSFLYQRHAHIYK